MHGHDEAEPPLETLAALGDLDDEFITILLLEGRLAELPRAEELAVWTAAAALPNPSARCVAAMRLGELKDARSADVLIPLLRDPELQVRNLAADALGRLKAAQAVPALIEALHDRSDSVRAYAAEALKEVGARQAVHPLLRALGRGGRATWNYGGEALWVLAAETPTAELLPYLDDRNPWVRAGACYVLGAPGRAEAVTPLLARLGDPHPYVRAAAAGALGRLGDARAAEPLIAALADPHPTVRSQAATGLRALPDPRAIGPLVAALAAPARGYSRSDVNLSIGWALAAQGEPGRLALLEQLDAPSPRVRRNALEALVPHYRGGPWAQQPLPERAVAALIARLRDAFPWNRRRAAEILGAVADPRALDALIRASRDPDPEVREDVVEALAAYDDPRALAALEWVAQHDTGQITDLDGWEHSLKDVATGAILKIQQRQQPDQQSGIADSDGDAESLTS